MSTLLALKIPIKGNTKTDIKSKKRGFWNLAMYFMYASLLENMFE